jgi:hypothetical protein
MGQVERVGFLNPMTRNVYDSKFKCTFNLKISPKAKLQLKFKLNFEKIFFFEFLILF